MADLAVSHLSFRQPDRAAPGGQRRVRVALPELVENGRVAASETALPGPGSAIPQPSSTIRQARGAGSTAGPAGRLIVRRPQQRRR